MLAALILGGLTVGAIAVYVIMKAQNPATVTAKISNVETWDLVNDDQGDLKRIVIHRDVKRNV